MEQKDDVQNEGDHHHDGVQDFKLVVEELQTEDIQFKENLHHKEGQDGNAHAVEHLERTRWHSESGSGAAHPDELALSAPARPPKGELLHLTPNSARAVLNLEIRPGHHRPGLCPACPLTGSWAMEALKAMPFGPGIYPAAKLMQAQRHIVGILTAASLKDKRFFIFFVE